MGKELIIAKIGVKKLNQGTTILDLQGGYTFVVTNSPPMSEGLIKNQKLLPNYDLKMANDIYKILSNGSI